MYKAHDTFFEEVKRKGCDIVLPCDEVVVFKMTADTEAVCKEVLSLLIEIHEVA